VSLRGKAVSAFKIFRGVVIYISCGFKFKRRMFKQQKLQQSWKIVQYTWQQKLGDLLSIRLASQIVQGQREV